MKNIFVEGIQGMGKSTLTNRISDAYPELHTCREGDYSPVDLAWCAWMNEEEYHEMLDKYASINTDITSHTVHEGNHYIVSYTQIITDIPGFHKDLEQYEIYNGRKQLSELKEIAVSRYHNFKESGYLFECAFFQNIVEDLILFHMLSDDEIVDFYKELYKEIDKEKFLLLYLYSDNIADNIKVIKKERCDNEGNEMWYYLMNEYFVNSPYGIKNNCHDIDDLVAHFKHRQQVELRIINEVVGDNAKIVPAKSYEMETITKWIRQ